VTALLWAVRAGFAAGTVPFEHAQLVANEGVEISRLAERVAQTEHIRAQDRIDEHWSLLYALELRWRDGRMAERDAVERCRKCRFEKLKQYKATVGHTYAPAREREHGELAKFTSEARAAYDASLRAAPVAC
jgi:hypothetical protein